MTPTDNAQTQLSNTIIHQPNIFTCTALTRTNQIKYLIDSNNRSIKLNFSFCEGSKHKKIILGIHGFAEHSGSFNTARDFFINEGYDFITFDLPGFGGSDGQRAFIEDFDEYIDVVRLVHSEILNFSSDENLVFYAHSMGGLISLLYLSKYHSNIAGLILTAPLINLSLANRISSWIAYKLFHKLLPKKPLFYRINYKILSNIPHQINALRLDKYRTRRINLSFLKAMFEAISRLKDEKNLPKCPVLVVKACSDKVIDPSSIDTFFPKLSHRLNQLLCLSTSQHDIIHDIRQQEILSYFKFWLGKIGSK